VRIEVTAEDIRAGSAGDPWLCPVARALRRTTGRGWLVDDDTLDRLRDNAHLGSVPCPPEVADFVLAFDRGDAVAPFAFDLEVPA
jgi:hypothetical protein